MNCKPLPPARAMDFSRAWQGSGRVGGLNNQRSTRNIQYSSEEEEEYSGSLRCRDFVGLGDFSVDSWRGTLDNEGVMFVRLWRMDSGFMPPN